MSCADQHFLALLSTTKYCINQLSKNKYKLLITQDTLDKNVPVIQFSELRVRAHLLFSCVDVVMWFVFPSEVPGVACYVEDP